MAGLFDFIAGIGEAIGAAFNFFISFISDIVYVVELTASFLTQIPSLFAWLPGAISALIVTGFGIVVVYKVLGREG